MGILALTGSVMLFALFAFVVLFILIRISSSLALLILFITPVIFILLMPAASISFLSYRHMLLADGLVPVNNFHILLMMWSTLIVVILYTEFFTWYLGKAIRMRRDRAETPNEKEPLIEMLKDTTAFVRKAKPGLLKRN